MKIVSLVGARPQFIKEAILHREFKKRDVQEIIINSGQHYDYNMSDMFLETLEIKPPDYNLEVGSGSHGAMTGSIMAEFEKILERIHPEIVLVYGDTNTTLAGALVAAKMKIDVAHIEAGIRMLPKNMPEEINRVVVDRISTKLFCPSMFAVENLEKEGIKTNVHFVGDVMYDLYLQMEDKFEYEVYNTLKLKDGEYVVLTMHRDYNVDDPQKLENILGRMAEINRTMKVVFPIHPRTRKRITDYGLEKYIKAITTIEPCDYMNLMGLVKNAYKVITDSGGLQKEAYFARKECAVLMPDTGWVELVKSGFNSLCDADNLIDTLFSAEKHREYIPGIYGNGDAGGKIADLIINGSV